METINKRWLFVIVGVVLLLAVSIVAYTHAPSTDAVPQNGQGTISGTGTGTSTAVTSSAAIVATSTPTSTTVLLSPHQVTLDDNGKTIRMKVGDSFLLNLGGTYTWNVNSSDQSVLKRKVNVLVIRGAQGIYDAVRSGTVTLTATGDPQCRATHPPCMLPSLMFSVRVIVS